MIKRPLLTCYDQAVFMPLGLLDGIIIFDPLLHVEFLHSGCTWQVCPLKKKCEDRHCQPFFG